MWVWVQNYYNNNSFPFLSSRRRHSNFLLLLLLLFPSHRCHLYVCKFLSLSRFSLCLSLRYAMQALLTASTDNAQKPIANRVYVIAKTFVPPNQIATAVREYLSLAVLVSGGKRVVNGVTCFYFVWPLCVSASGLAGSAAATKLQFPARFVYKLITHCRVLSFFSSLLPLSSLLMSCTLLPDCCDTLSVYTPPSARSLSVSDFEPSLWLWPSKNLLLIHRKMNVHFFPIELGVVLSLCMTQQSSVRTQTPLSQTFSGLSKIS